MKRLLGLVLLVAAAIAACDRVVDLTPPPDAHGDGHGSDGSTFLPDGQLSPDAAGIHQDGGTPPDGFVVVG